MEIKVLKVFFDDIKTFRSLYLTEINDQIRYNAVHERGWSDSYQLMLNDTVVGYGSIKGKDNHANRDTIFEFYIIPPFRKVAPLFFRNLLSVSGAAFIECQSNDELLAALLYEFAEEVKSDIILFADHAVTQYNCKSVVFRPKRESDLIFKHRMEPIGDYVLEFQGNIVATGGFMLHYNIPFADLYMEVEKDFQRRGFGSFLIQELKRECYISGRVPAARCNRDNQASMATLLKAGLKISGFMLEGKMVKNLLA
jgi:GNAT superfamily N-acetyltransferase